MSTAWKQVRLAQIASMQYGYTASAEMSGTGPKLLRITDIVPDYLSWDSVPNCKIGEREEEVYRLHDGDIVVARIGATAGYAKLIISPPRSVFASYLIRILPGDSCDKYYLGLLLESAMFKKFIDKTKGGSAQPQANVPVIGRFMVPLPPMSIQKRIRSIIMNYRFLCENNNRRISILESLARKVYDEWFVKFEFPGHELVRVVDSEFGKIPEGWNMRRLDEIADLNRLNLVRGKGPSEIKYVDISSVAKGRIMASKSISFAEAPGRARRQVSHGDIIWSSVRPNLRAYALILNPPPNLIVSTGFAVITPTEVPCSFLFASLTTDEFVGYLVSHTRGSAYPAVNTEDFEKARILVPPQEILLAFDKIAMNLYSLIDNLQSENFNLMATCDLLLPKLISGELDVSEIEVENLPVEV